jgi:hypothetical protein
MTPERRANASVANPSALLTRFQIKNPAGEAAGFEAELIPDLWGW